MATGINKLTFRRRSGKKRKTGTVGFTSPQQKSKFKKTIAKRDATLRKTKGRPKRKGRKISTMSGKEKRAAFLRMQMQGDLYKKTKSGKRRKASGYTKPRGQQKAKAGRKRGIKW